ncbi:sigma-54 interaction domain-containing protein [Aromatoleum sp.]|uniref:sigma-54 interaction domain-containing protein n=1 Tax=Aromatoleum sp. TaxID=2307007 RepID=UPI002FC9C8EF
MPCLTTLGVFLDSLEEGVMFLDAARRVLEINSAAARMIGVDAQRVADELCPTLFSGTPCARACVARGSCSLTPEQGEAGKIQDIVLKSPEGRDVPLRMWAMLLPENDAGLYCAIVLRDRSREVELEAEVRDRWQLGGLTGRSRAMQDFYQKVLRVAGSEANVLVTGESGVGKELVARALHDNSTRAKGAYIAVHCASLPENLLETELFGHAKGAFSGATAARPGRFEAAHGGTLLLDEIGEISPATQTKLLRVLQEREIVRVGENLPRKVDVRVVAATHRDLAAMVARGEFREDLYYRLHVLPLHVPALRERREDIALLASTLLRELAERYRRPDLRLSPEAITEMESFSWPGNVRQLFNSLEYAVVNSDGALILPGHLPPEATIATPDRRAVPRPVTRYYTPPATEGDERREILRVLAESGGNRAEAARRLGMSRTTLWKRLNQM